MVLCSSVQRSTSSDEPWTGRILISLGLGPPCFQRHHQPDHNDNRDAEGAAYEAAHIDYLRVQSINRAQQEKSQGCGGWGMDAIRRLEGRHERFCRIDVTEIQSFPPVGNRSPNEPQVMTAPQIARAGCVSPNAELRWVGKSAGFLGFIGSSRKKKFVHPAPRLASAKSKR